MGCSWTEQPTGSKSGSQKSVKYFRRRGRFDALRSYSSGTVRFKDTGGSRERRTGTTGTLDLGRSLPRSVRVPFQGPRGPQTHTHTPMSPLGEASVGGAHHNGASNLRRLTTGPGYFLSISYTSEAAPLQHPLSQRTQSPALRLSRSLALYDSHLSRIVAPRFGLVYVYRYRRTAE